MHLYMEILIFRVIFILYYYAKKNINTSVLILVAETYSIIKKSPFVDKDGVIIKEPFKTLSFQETSYQQSYILVKSGVVGLGSVSRESQKVFKK